MQLVWRGSPSGGLHVEVGDEVAVPEPTPQAEILLSVINWRGAPAVAAASPAGDEAGRAGGSLGGFLKGSRVLDPAWPGGPGSIVVGGLAPRSTYDVVASADGVAPWVAARFTTLQRPPGDLLFKLATVTDLHIGEKHFGIWGRIWDGQESEPGAETYPVRCLRAALEEATAWGAELIIAKGDLTRRATAAELRDAARLLEESPVPVETVLGNHDNALNVDMRSVLASCGVPVTWGPRAIDVPGLRIVLANSVHGNPRYHRGHLPAVVGKEVASLAAAASSPAIVVLHHPPELHQYRTVYPPGIPLDESVALLDALAKEHPQTLVTCGHRHRNRRYSYGPLVISETGSTKDYPGVWTGYKVYEGGIVQVVRRTARPDVIGWTEATRRAMNGQWGRWSPGRLADRCFGLMWA